MLAVDTLAAIGRRLVAPFRRMQPEPVYVRHDS
jgi:hypothetical protein